MARRDSRLLPVPARPTEARSTRMALLQAQDSGATVGTYPIEEAIERTPGGNLFSRTSVRGRTLAASAQVLTTGRVKSLSRAKKKRVRAAERWQDEVWALRDQVGELRFVGDRQARNVSQVRLYIGKRTKLSRTEPEPVTDGVPGELSDMLFGDQAGVEQKVKRYSQHIIYAGESILLIAEDEDDPNRLTWDAHSSAELLGQSEVNYQITDGVKPRKIDPERELVIRSWNPHPKLSALADAPVKAVLPVLRELVQMTKYQGAQMDSRLAGSGILLISDRVESLMKRPEGAPDDYSFVDELVDYMMEPLEDRAAAGSVVPFVAKVPGENPSQMMHHLTFDSPLDPHMHERREEAIRRIGLGMDSDPSVLLGMASANHWSAWSVDESEIKLGVAPIAATLCHTLTTKVVRPLLQAAQVADADEYMVWFDTGALKLRPDRSKDAQSLNERGLLSDERARVEAGFDETDAPTNDELNTRMIRDLIKSDPYNLGPLLGPKIGLEWPTAPTDSAPAADLSTPVDEPVDEETTGVQGPPDTQLSPPPAADDERSQ